MGTFKKAAFSFLLLTPETASPDPYEHFQGLGEVADGFLNVCRLGENEGLELSPLKFEILLQPFVVPLNVPIEADQVLIEEGPFFDCFRQLQLTILQELFGV